MLQLIIPFGSQHCIAAFCCDKSPQHLSIAIAIRPTKYNPPNKKFLALLIDFGAEMGFLVGFRAFCGTNSGRTRRSHNFFSSYPNWMQKEAR